MGHKFNAKLKELKGSNKVFTATDFPANSKSIVKNWEAMTGRFKKEGKKVE